MPIKKKTNKKKEELIKKEVGENIQIEQEQPEIPVHEEFYQIPTRFGNVPIDKAPLGWDENHRFEKVYPRVSLPFQQIERVSFGHPKLEPNRLFFGDNLHIMRMLPSKSIDLIYIDPPFFSGRNYNILYGDKNELRSFRDIWEGGMPGYLIWLNARLYEMKRLLKPEGSIYVHLDWHAAHYVKVEMDKIFGYDNFRNEIVWAYTRPGTSFQKQFSRVHDTILWYSKTHKWIFNGDDVRIPYSERTIGRGKYSVAGSKVTKGIAERVLPEGGKIPEDWWQIPMIQGNAIERLGYPTQKPEALLERIIKASSNEGDVVADFFCGGGTMPAVAQKLNRNWIASDISRIAVALTADRLSRAVEEGEGEKEGKRKIQPTFTGINEAPDFTVEHWGIYEIHKLGKMKPAQFRKFIIESYNGRPDTISENIHGYKNGEPLFVGDPEPDDRITKEEVISFAKEILTKKGIHKGTMLGWAFSPDARIVREKLAAREGISLDFVKLNLIPIDSPEFRSHITDRHPSYVDLVSFILPPLIRFGFNRIGERKYEFDVSESTSMNSNGKIINVQWDFDYKTRFSSTRGFSFLRGEKNESLLKVEYDFTSTGKKKIACRVQDDLGGEATLIKEIDVE